VRVLIAGANGKTGKQLVELLVHRGHQVRAMIRNPEQAPGLEEIGAEPYIADLEKEVSHAVPGCDAMIFAAGGGPGSGPEKKETVDYGGAVKLMDAALEHGVSRYLMLSAMRTDEIENAPEKLHPYLRAKGRADRYLMETRLDYTIIRPGRLNNEAPSHHIDAAESLGRYGEVSRADVALTFAEALEMENLFRKTFEMLAGEMPIREALERL